MEKRKPSGLSDILQSDLKLKNITSHKEDSNKAGSNMLVKSINASGKKDRRPSKICTPSSRNFKESINDDLRTRVGTEDAVIFFNAVLFMVDTIINKLDIDIELNKLRSQKNIPLPEVHSPFKKINNFRKKVEYRYLDEIGEGPNEQRESWREYNRNMGAGSPKEPLKNQNSTSINTIKKESFSNM